MSKVAILTEEQKDKLIGEYFCPYSYFNPVQDCNGNWIISQEEIIQCCLVEFIWIKDLPLIDWCEPTITHPDVTDYSE